MRVRSGLRTPWSSLRMKSGVQCCLKSMPWLPQFWIVSNAFSPLKNHSPYCYHIELFHMCIRRWAHAKLWSKMPNPVFFGCGIHLYRLRNSLDSSQLRFQPPAIKKWPFPRCGGGGWLFFTIWAHLDVNDGISDDLRGLKYVKSAQNFPRNPKN